MDKAGAKKFEDEGAPALVDSRFGEDENGKCEKETDIDGEVAEEGDFDVVAEGKPLSEGKEKKRKPSQGSGKDGAMNDIARAQVRRG